MNDDQKYHSQYNSVQVVCVIVAFGHRWGWDFKGQKCRKNKK